MKAVTVSNGLTPVLLSQFLSALADNALLFAAIALLKATGAPAWHTPLLQEFFLIAYIVLAPFVGHVADAWPKGRVMLIANALKLSGAGAMMAGLNPLVAYGLVGVGAAAYSPAKYGILGELVPANKLVSANGLLEGSTIAAILLGAVLGGMLADSGASVAVAFTVAVYGLAALANFKIPTLEPATACRKKSPVLLLKEFRTATATLLRHSETRLSLLGTSVFWGTGSTLRFLLVAWVPVALGLTDTATPANFSGVVAVGIAIGAGLAARYVTLNCVYRVVPAGLALGALIVGFSFVTTISLSLVFLVLIGLCGGFYVVPLNALLQEHGKQHVGAGQVIAVQNFFENVAMLVAIGAYMGMLALGWSPITTSALFGATVLTGIGLLSMKLKRQNAASATTV